MSVKRDTQSYRSYSKRLVAGLNAIDVEQWDRAADVLYESWCGGQSVFVAGNGGSFSTALHFSTDWSKGLYTLTNSPMIVRCLGSNPSLLTAFSNDIQFDDAFYRDLEMETSLGGVLVVISGSGNSKNILKVAKYAQNRGFRTIGLIGYDGGELIKNVDFPVHVKVDNMQIVEDLHSSFGHYVLEYIYARSLKSGI
jgi:D-sedoheptulose 7-phosphate isomerase